MLVNMDKKELVKEVGKDNIVYLKDDKYPHLCNLINNLTMDIQNNNVKHILHPKKLLASLYKLYNLIGMHKLKESIAQQTSFLMSKMKQGNLSLKMLNTILMGNPGTGKTNCGCILAEIWYHMGFLKASMEKKGIAKTYLSKLSEYNTELLQFYFIFVFIIINKLYTNVIKPMYHKVGLLVLLFLLSMLLSFFYLILATGTSDDLVYTENDMITIAGRTNFVDIYLGGTANKTNNFLNTNRGKVVFIDESYNLYNNSNDSYGAEALGAINKFLSENPEEIVVIFAGYEDLMKEGIFKIQPGLSRRCMWHFRCDKYNGEELYKIFKLELQKENLEINFKDQFKVHDYIVKHEDKFPNMGGDCNKLVYYVQLNHAAGLDRDSNYVTYEEVKQGVKELTLNNINTSTTKTDFMTELAKKFIK
jgi:hypothetical protein